MKSQIMWATYPPNFPFMKCIKFKAGVFSLPSTRRYKWLNGNKEKPKLFCWPCLLLNANNCV